MGLIELPRPLSPWAGILGLFPREVALALAPLLQRLHALLGEGRGAAGVGLDPDGYGGVARRGPYERLLGTEWLLLTEIPEEFLRRVVAGEHSFLEVAHRPPSAGRRAVVLFDAGPDQLGGPRIAHLAALVVLAARLERQKGSLSWGVLQDETGALQGEVSAANVWRLFAARSGRAAAREDVVRWLGDSGVRGASELWLAGGEDLRAEGERRSTSMLIVTDTLEPGARRLAVQALAAGASRAAEGVLDLPAETACIRILRDPFLKAMTAGTAGSSGPATPDPSSGLVFASNGRRLFLRGKGGQLLIFVVPNSPRAPVPPLAVFVPPAGQSIVAVGHERSKSRTVVVCAGEGAYFSHRLALSRTSAIGSHGYRPAEDLVVPEGPPGPLVLLLVEESGALCFPASSGGDVVLEGDTASAGTARARRAGSLWRVDDGAAMDDLPPDDTAPPERRWTVGHLGQAMDSTDRERPAADNRRRVLLDERRRRIDLLQRDERQRLLSTPSPIHAVRVDAALGLIGYVTEAGEIGVYSITASALVLHVHPGSGAP